MEKCTPVCAEPSERFPNGRTGTIAGYGVHCRAGELPCNECREGRKAHRRRANNQASKKWRERNPDEARSAKHRVIGRNRSVVQEAKKQPCTDCGVQYPYYVMEFDHLEAETKSFNVSAGVTRASYVRLLAEIAKCEVVCANCHAERTHQRRRRKEATTSAPDRSCGGVSSEENPARDAAS